ncbi:hypothetical protein BJ912DRAFT_136982 [Pholiota molesta]|nr:hypothetical protein BJ912DRAFT_136982 [Pholiota molesta]
MCTSDDPFPVPIHPCSLTFTTTTSFIHCTNPHNHTTIIAEKPSTRSLSDLDAPFMHHQDLPFDVWEHITTFLSPEETIRLLSVNCTLFTIAMNERYRTSRIETLLQTDTCRNLARLTDPEVAYRVHRLILRPGHICRAVQDSENAKKKSKIATVPKFTTKIHKIIKASLLGKRKESPLVISHQRGVPAEVAAQNLLTIMGLLKELRSLVIDIHGSEHWCFQQTAIPFFPVGWSTFRTTLRSLELRVPVEDLVLILPNPSLDGILPNLDTISLLINRASIATPQGGVILVEKILPFLQSHRRTLRSLTLENDHDMAERINLSPLLLELRLSSLTHFTLVQPFASTLEEADYTGLLRFFHMHSSHLTHFTIATGLPSIFDAASQPYPFFSHECFATPLPQLEHLAVDYTSPDAHDLEALCDPMIRYIHQFKTTLVSLKLDTYYVWTLEDVRLLVEGFASSARLQRLDILAACFEPELLTVLAANLPHLEVLNISMLCVSPRGRVPFYPFVVVSPDVPLDSRQFASNMRALSFPQWRLRNLNLQVSGSGPDARTAVYYLKSDLSKSALLEALPNVEVFCGLSRHEY